MFYISYFSENFDVSLNRKEPLVGDEKPLKELGLVPGDLVHVLLKEDAQGILITYLAWSNIKYLGF